MEALINISGRFAEIILTEINGRRGVQQYEFTAVDMFFEFLFLRQFSISKFHIWREGVSTIDTPSLQI